MATMGRYCKAYLLGQLRAFPGWSEQADQARPETQEVDGVEREAPRTLRDDDVVYLHETYAVADGIFLDEHVLFDQVTPEWQEFCRRELGFEVPPEEPSGGPG